MALKLLVIGANAANAEELKAVVLATVGGAAEIATATLDNYKQVRDADLNVCLVNRQSEMENVFGPGKVVGIELVRPRVNLKKCARSLPGKPCCCSIIARRAPKSC